MKKHILTATLAILLAATPAIAENEWLHIYYKNGSKSRVVSRPASTPANITHKGSAEECHSLVLNDTESSEMPRELKLANVDSCVIGAKIPTIKIVTDEYVDEIPSKDYYMSAQISIEGFGLCPDFETKAVNIKGRGNSTWSFPKKPYRLKFDKKAEFGGLKKAKSFALIANWIDETGGLRNAIALKTASLLGMPFTNSCIPVDVTRNGKPRGPYMLTEKIGINGASVDIDETTGILFELDTNYDEEFKFYSKRFGLPVMVKDPDLNELAAENPEGESAQEMFERWRTDFEAFESRIGFNDIDSKLDMTSAVNYVLLNLLTNNGEPGWPKSVYMYKANADDLFHFGPAWDYDWAFNYDQYKGTTETYNTRAFSSSSNSAGAKMFYRLVTQSSFKKMIRERFDFFKEELLPQLLEYIDEYTATIEASALADAEIWDPLRSSSWASAPGASHFRKNNERLKQWLMNRIDFIDRDPNMGLY